MNIFTKLQLFLFKKSRTKVMNNEITKFLELIKHDYSNNPLSEMEIFKLLYTHLLMLNYKYIEISDVLHDRYTNIIEITKSNMDE